MLKGIFWDLLDKVLNQGIGFVISIFLARILTPEDFGLVGMVMVFVGFSQVFMDLGFSTALIQKQDVSEEQLSTVFYLNVAVGILLSCILFAASPLIAGFYERPLIAPLMRVVSVLFIINSLTIVQTAYFIKAINLKPLTIYRGVAVIISGSVGIAMAFSDFGVWSLVVQSILNSLIFTVLIWIGSAWRPIFYFNLASIKELWHYGSKLLAAGLLENIFNRLDVVIIGKMFSPASLGYYTRAQSLNTLVMQYSSESLMKVFLPAISRNQQHTAKVKQLYEMALATVSFAAFGLLGVLFVSAENLIVLLFTEKWLQSAEYFQILVLGGFVYPLSAVMVNVLSGRGKSGDFLILQVLKKIFVALAFIIGFQIGIVGFLYSLVVAYIFSILLNMFFVTKEISITIGKQIGIIMPYMMMSVVSVIPANLLSNYFSTSRIISLIIEVGTVAFVYLLLNFAGKTQAFFLLKGKISLIIKKL